MEGGRRSEGVVRARAFLTTQKPLGAKHKCPLPTLGRPGRGVTFRPQSQSWG